MYFLLKEKPQCVLGKHNRWIPMSELSRKADRVCVYSTYEDAIAAQKSISHSCASFVIKDKTLLKHAKLSSLPEVFQKTVRKSTHSDKRGSNAALSKTYSEYLEDLCSEESDRRETAVFEPTNMEETVNTPEITQLCTKLRNIESMLRKFDEDTMRISDEIRGLDLLLSDRLHQIELCSISDDDCVALIQNLKRLRIKRRKLKNELHAVCTAKSVFSAIDTDGIHNAIKDIDSLSTKEYRCRVLEESQINCFRE